MAYIKSPLQWAGSKFRFLNYVYDFFPSEEIDTYYELFLGSSSVVLNLPNDIKINKFILNDSNEKLILFYEVVRDDPLNMLRILNSLPVQNEPAYYTIRTKFNNKIGSKSELAAYFLYMNKCGYNGLYRENKLGAFNVPYGGDTRCKGLKCEDSIMKLHHLFNKSNVYLNSNDFRFYRNHINPNDFIYSDPPFYGTFSSYTFKRFSEKDHMDLYEFYEEMRKNNIRCLQSNSDCDWVVGMYDEFKIFDYLYK